MKDKTILDEMKYWIKEKTHKKVTNGSTLLETIMAGSTKIYMPNKLTFHSRVKRGCRAMDIYKKDLYSSEFFACIMKNEHGFKENVPDSFVNYVRASDGFIPQLYMGASGLSQYVYSNIFLPVVRMSEWDLTY